MPTLVSLPEAITAVETAATALSTSDMQKADATTKFDAAKAALDTASANNKTATEAFNAAIDMLIAAANAAKRTVA